MSAGRWLDLIAVEVLHVFCRIVQSTMDFIVLGEAATKVMDSHADFAQEHPQVPWRGMRGMRNRMAHGYFDIDLDMVWNTVQNALPDLLSQLSALRPPADSADLS